MWARSAHPNILQYFGITDNPLQVVTEWVSDGNVVGYVRTHPNVDRVRMVNPHVRLPNGSRRSTSSNHS